MSRYLIDRIRSLENVDIQVRSEIVELHGGRAGGLESATVRNRDSGATSSLPARHVFMFIGAEPNTAWLNGCVALDEHGYILTGLGRPPQAPATLPLQTSLPRVFAIGDVRSGSTKRVASAVGEGAAVVAQIHWILGAATTTADRTAAAPRLQQLLARLRHHREHARTADILARTGDSWSDGRASERPLAWTVSCMSDPLRRRSVRLLGSRYRRRSPAAQSRPRRERPGRPDTAGRFRSRAARTQRRQT